MRTRHPRGFTFAEIFIVAALLSGLVLGLARFMGRTSEAATRQVLSTESNEAIRLAMDEVERDLMDMVALTSAGPHEIEFRMDSHRRVGFDDMGEFERDPSGNPAPDGIPNIRDADMDNDAGTLVPPADRWKVGFNIQDDDDDNDGRVDVVCRYHVSHGALVREIVENEDAVFRTVVLHAADKGGGFDLDYFGNVNDLQLGVNADDNGDRIVTEAEIDRAENHNHALDTDLERAYVHFIRVRLAQDHNGDGEADYHLTAEIAPPLLPVRRALP